MNFPRGLAMLFFGDFIPVKKIEKVDIVFCRELSS